MNPYLVAIIAILIGHYLVETLAGVLTIKHLDPVLPPEFEGYFDPGQYRRSHDYIRKNTKFEITTDSIFLALTATFILAGGFNLIDRIARGLQLGAIPTGLVFAGISVLLHEIISVPFSAYSTFVIEEKFGFNKTTVHTFVFDILKTWALIALIGGIVFACVVWLFEKTGSQGWIYCWIAMSAWGVLMSFFAPVVILPLFNKFVPMESGGVRSAVEDYVRSQGYKMRGVFTMDGSKRSTKTNAFFIGFGRYKRLALFDTLLARHTPDEIVAIVAHEVGHYKRGHVIKSLVVSVLTNGLMFYLLSFFLNNKGLFAAFRMEHVSVYASLFFFGFLYVPVNFVLSVLINCLSRRWEHDADIFAARTTSRPESMVLALKKLGVTNLANLTPHPAVVFLTYSHPPLLQRIGALRETSVKPNITLPASHSAGVTASKYFF